MALHRRAREPADTDFLLTDPKPREVITICRFSRIPPSCAREETAESRGMPCLFLNTERGFGGKPPKKSGFRRHLARSKMPKETFFTAISRWRVVSRRALNASGF